MRYSETIHVDADIVNSVINRPALYDMFSGDNLKEAGGFIKEEIENYYGITLPEELINCVYFGEYCKCLVESIMKEDIEHDISLLKPFSRKLITVVEALHYQMSADYKPNDIFSTLESVGNMLINMLSKVDVASFNYLTSPFYAFAACNSFENAPQGPSGTTFKEMIKELYDEIYNADDRDEEPDAMLYLKLSLLVVRFSSEGFGCILPRKAEEYIAKLNQRHSFHMTLTRA